MLASDMCTAVKSQTLFSAVSSGWTSIDHILGEIGYKAGEVNEICGAAGVGKTQMCLKAAISLLQKHESSRVVWIETSDDHRLSSEKAYEMAAVHLKSLHRESEGDAQSYDGSLDVKKVTSVLGRIIIHECSGIKSLFNLLDNIHQIHDELAQVNADSPPMLIVVDSLSTVLTDHLWATDGSGHALVMQISRQLRALAQDLNLVVLVTTTAVLSSSSEEQNLSILISSKFKPGLGSCWKFATDLQLYVTRVETPPSQWQDPMLQLNPILPTSKLNTRVIEITRSRRLVSELRCK
ncbi:DNA repair protein rad51d [Podila humilis]|nr:DNA repair protein rad51d [Podila humilis]